MKKSVAKKAFLSGPGREVLQVLFDDYREGDIIMRDRIVKIQGEVHRSADKAIKELLKVGALENLSPDKSNPRRRGRPPRLFRVHPQLGDEFFWAFIEDYRLRLLPAVVADALKEAQLAAPIVDLDTMTWLERGKSPEDGTSPFALRVPFYPGDPQRTRTLTARERKRLRQIEETALHLLALASFYMSYLMFRGLEVPLVILPFMAPMKADMEGLESTLEIMSRTRARVDSKRSQ